MEATQPEDSGYTVDFDPVEGALLVVGTGSDVKPGEAAEKLGGTAVARLLTSGETNAVIDLAGLG